MQLNNIISSLLRIEGGALFYTPPFYAKGISYIFYHSSFVLEAYTLEEMNSILEEAELLRKEYIGYFYLSYEAGYLMEERLQRLYKPSAKQAPLIKFLFFRKGEFRKIPSEEIEIDYSCFNDHSIKSFKLDTSKTEYTDKVKLIKDHIINGDTYQANYTVKGKFALEGDIRSLFTNLIFNQTTKYTCFINNVNDLFISLSPELFFEVSDDKINTMPMKGTIRRGINNDDDKLKYTELQSSRKDRAENVMIVDLLRNDIGRICKVDTVKADSIYSIEKYESLFQMVSTVTGTLVNGTLKDIIKNIYPCGSITGAPKIRTMEIINSIEKEQRGIYTGTIGLLEPDKITCSVPIRTLCIDSRTGEGEIGIGSGIVADSVPEKEYEESLLKCNFLLKPLNYFELFETMRVEQCNVFLLDEHLERLKEAASYFLFIYDEQKILSVLNDVLSKLDKDMIYRLKLTLAKSGTLKFEPVHFLSNSFEKKIIISNKIVSTENKFQYFKTTNRELYSSEYRKYKDRYADVIFFNEKGELAEGSITNIIIKLDGIWYTTPVSSGILNGVYRSFLLKNETIKEKILYREDLLNSIEVRLINSLRKEIPVKSIYQDDLCIHELNHNEVY